MALLGDVAELAILLKLKNEVTRPLKNIERDLSHLNTTTGTVSGGMTKIGAGLATAAVRTAVIATSIAGSVGGIAIAATKAASDYQAAMELLRTQTGATQKEVDDMSVSVLELSKQLPQSATELAAGLYHIESAGFRGAKALDLLKTAAQGAATGQAELEDVTNAMIAADQSGVKGVQDMGAAMGTLNGIVGAGNMRMSDLTAAFGTGILSTAKTFGVSIQSVGAALADMTDQGIPAIDAATRLRMTMSLMAAPTSKAAKGMESIGLGSLDIAKAMRGPDGILGGVKLLAEHMQKAGLIDKQGNPNTKGAALLSSMFGGGRSSSAIMTLIGNLDLFQQKQDAVNKGATGFADAWTATNATVQVKMGELHSSIGGSSCSRSPRTSSTRCRGASPIRR
jgi:TP901 family phage tail tape measure protein